MKEEEKKQDEKREEEKEIKEMKTNKNKKPQLQTTDFVHKLFKLLFFLLPVSPSSAGLVGQNIVSPPRYRFNKTLTSSVPAGQHEEKQSCRTTNQQLTVLFKKETNGCK